jgi:serine/threonine protein kinase
LQIDIWSLGITCLELANGEAPMHTLHYMKVMLEIPQRPAPTLEGGNWSPAFRAFVARCLRKSPRAVRPHAQRQYGSGWS